MTSLRLRRALPRAEVRRVVVLDIDGLHTSHPVRPVRRGLAAAGIYYPGKKVSHPCTYSP